ncbi:MAG: choice-of-anchor Q domain-containing protein, partial [Gammaproteobacteria bacterium]
MVCKNRQHRGVYWQCLYLVLILTLNNALNSVFAATLYVNPNSLNCPDTNGPEVYCTIQAAISAAHVPANVDDPPDTIYIAPGLYRESLRLDNATSRFLTIIGSGVSHTIIDSASRAFLIQEDSTIKNLTIEKSGPPRSGMGGGLYVEGSDITVNVADVVLAGNYGGVGGGIAIMSGNVNLQRVAVINNTASILAAKTNSTELSSGAGIFVQAGATLVATNSVISGNVAAVGVVPNQADLTGGGFGAGIYNLGNTMLVNTSISGNTAHATDIGGGGITNGNATNSAVLSLYNVTISNNSTANDGGGVYNFNGTVDVRNSIIAGNTASGTAPNCGANSSNVFSSQGYNIIGVSTGCGDTEFPPATSDTKDVTAAQLNMMPMPVDSSQFGGLPIFLFHGLNTNSTAIDSVGVNSCLGQDNTPLTSDQRGVTRPFDGDNNGTALCDAGAFELAEELTVYPSELFTFEDQGISTFYIALGSPPAQSVQLNITSQTNTEGTIATPTISFDNTDWNTPKPVQINVQNDGLADGNQTYTVDIAATGIGVAATSVKITNIDTIIPADLVVDLTSINIREGGPSQAFGVRLATPPAAGSVVVVEVSHALSAGEQQEATITPSSLQFNDSNWNIVQDFTATAIDDTAIDGSVSYDLKVAVTSTTDSAYLGKEVIIPMTVDDNEQPSGNAGITFFDATNITTTEGGQTTFSVALDAAPSAEVKLNFVSNATDEGLFLDSNQNSQQNFEIIFTPQNWDQAQMVTVIGVDDDFADGAQRYTVRMEIVTIDTDYGGLTPDPLTIINNDNDTAAIIVTPSPPTRLVTDESGATTTFQVQLATPPDPSTVVTLAAIVEPPDSGLPLEGVVTLPPNQLVFDSDNYDQPQTVTVTGLDDCVADGDKNYVITITYNIAGTTSGPYANPNINRTIDVTNSDNESTTPQIVISKTQLHTSENLTSDSFDVCITTQPSEQVTITMTIPPAGEPEGVFENDSTTQEIVFDQSNWSAVQTITVA